MDGEFLAVGKPDIGQEPLIASDQPRFDQWGLKLHAPSPGQYASADRRGALLLGRQIC